MIKCIWDTRKSQKYLLRDKKMLNSITLLCLKMMSLKKFIKESLRTFNNMNKNHKFLLKKLKNKSMTTMRLRLKLEKLEIN